MNGAMIIQLWGKQRMPKEKKQMTTAEFFRRRAEQRLAGAAVGGGKSHGKVSIMNVW